MSLERETGTLQAPEEGPGEGLIGYTLEGVYRIDDIISRGATSVVYRGTNLRLEQPIAIKMLAGYLTGDEALMARFASEAKMQAKLRHPSIVAVQDFVVVEDVYAIIMEYFDGVTLDQVLYDLDGPMAVDAVLTAIYPVLDAIAFAHHQGIVHRDIKPSNILMARVGGREYPKVMDFGIAKALAHSGSQTQPGAMLGTLLYMSPEQCKALKSVDERSDVYSLGITLYQMATGMVPFYAESAFDIMMAHVQTPPPSPRRLVPSVPRKLEEIILRALQKDPAKRFQSVEEIKAELQHVGLGGEAPPSGEVDQHRLQVPTKHDSVQPSSSRVVGAEIAAAIESSLEVERIETERLAASDRGPRVGGAGALLRRANADARRLSMMRMPALDDGGEYDSDTEIVSVDELRNRVIAAAVGAGNVEIAAPGQAARGGPLPVREKDAALEMTPPVDPPVTAARPARKPLSGADAPPHVRRIVPTPMAPGAPSSSAAQQQSGEEASGAEGATAASSGTRAPSVERPRTSTSETPTQIGIGEPPALSERPRPTGTATRRAAPEQGRRPSLPWAGGSAKRKHREKRRRREQATAEIEAARAAEQQAAREAEEHALREAEEQVAREEAEARAAEAQAAREQEAAREAEEQATREAAAVAREAAAAAREAAVAAAAAARDAMLAEEQTAAAVAAEKARQPGVSELRPTRRGGRPTGPQRPSDRGAEAAHDAKQRAHELAQAHADARGMPKRPAKPSAAAASKHESTGPQPRGAPVVAAVDPEAIFGAGWHDGSVRRLKLRVPSREDWGRYFDPNIFGGGIFCPSQDPPEVGTPVRVEITFVGGPRFHVRGAVTWRRVRLNDPRARAGVGVQVHPSERSKVLYVSNWVKGGIDEKRGLRRLPVRIRVTYTGRAGRRVNFTRDVNEAGVFLRSQELLERGTHIKLVMLPPTSHAPFDLRGEVTRVVEGRDERGMGIRLIFKDASREGRWASFIEELERRFLSGSLPDDVVA